MSYNKIRGLKGLENLVDLSELYLNKNLFSSGIYQEFNLKNGSFDNVYKPLRDLWNIVKKLNKQHTA